MNKDEIQKAVVEDLEHLPRSEDGSAQNLFRSAYRMAKGYDLQRYAQTPKKDTFRKVLSVLQQQHPDFFPVCNKNYFEKQ